MQYKDFEFDWDEGNTHKIQARFTLEEIEAFFSQELLYAEDSRHSRQEPRELAIGKSTNGKDMYVCFTIRGNKIRVISARYMRIKEVNKYEAFKKNKES